MLQKLAHAMTTPFFTRRLAQATVAIMSLLAPGASPSDVDGDRSHLRVRLPGFTLWSTRCERPLLLHEAAAEARAEGRDALILRFATAVHVAPPVVFDWMSPTSSGGEWNIDLLPALAAGGGLSLVRAFEDSLRLDVSAEAIVIRDDLPPVWKLQRELATARATAVLNSRLWGGL